MNEAKGWIRRNWISAKKWFYKTVVLRDDYVPQFGDFSKNKTKKKKNKKGGGKENDYPDGLSDFDYNYGIAESYAYVWYEDIR